MRRLIAILFLALLPLQAVWAVAAAYCEHEHVPDTAHFGHHAHQHHDAQPSPLPGMADVDCHSCHGACAVLLPCAGTQLVLFSRPVLPGDGFRALPTPPLSPPERPNWLALA